MSTDLSLVKPPEVMLRSINSKVMSNLRLPEGTFDYCAPTVNCGLKHPEAMSWVKISPEMCTWRPRVGISPSGEQMRLCMEKLREAISGSNWQATRVLISQHPAAMWL